MLANPDVALKAIYSRSLASAKSAAESHAVDLYSDDSQPLDALLARDDISAVIIALPITAQPAVITKALAAGKHVLAEKPIAKDVASAKAPDCRERLAHRHPQHSGELPLRAALRVCGVAGRAARPPDALLRHHHEHDED